MKYLVNFTIGGVEYSISSDQPPEYIQRVAAYFNDRLVMATPAAKNNMLMAAVLAGLTVTDDFFNQKRASEGLRGQVKQYSDEIDRLRTQLDELRKTKGDY